MPTRLTAEFDDADQFVEQMALWGWQGRLSRIGRGDFSVSLQMAGDNTGRVVRTRHTVANLRDINTPADSRTFGLVIPEKSDNAWCGRSYDRAILQMMPRCDYVGANTGGHLGYQMVFPDPVVEEALESLEQKAPLAADAFRIELDTDRALGLATQIDRDWLASQHAGARVAADAVLMVLLEALTDPVECVRAVPETRRRAVSRAREFIDANLTEELTLADICRIAGVSRRTMTDAFREQLGIPPMRYLKLMRLHRVRKALLCAAPGTRVSGVANALGLWHMGQLARDYRTLFGELPTETLARS